VLQAPDGQHISLAGDRALTIKVDSLVTPGARMSMITEDLPPGAEIRVHLHSTRMSSSSFARVGASPRSATARFR
jgi:hypothetical protein